MHNNKYFLKEKEKRKERAGQENWNTLRDLSARPEFKTNCTRRGLGPLLSSQIRQPPTDGSHGVRPSCRCQEQK